MNGQRQDNQDRRDSASGLSRRRMLGMVAAGAAAGSAGALLATAGASAHGDIVTYDAIWNQRTVYEGTGNLASFGYRPSFHDRCRDWLQFWANNVPGTGFNTPFRVWSLGVHTDHRVTEAHNNGRGFDLTKIYTTNENGNLIRRFNARYDQWRGSADAAQIRERYWATAASLHHHFQHVLTYLYNTDHHTHIHFDNLVSGSGNSDFSTGSTAQVQHVQACCRFVWGKSTTIDGVWGPETRNHSDAVLQRIGRSGSLTSSQANWLAFNRATLRKGYGTENY